MGIGIALLLLQASVEDAMRLAAQGDFAGAQGVLSAFLVTHPRDADAHYRLGVVRMRQGQLAMAAASVEQAIRLAPSQPQFHLALAEIALRLDDRPKAIATGAAVARLAGENSRLWRALADLQQRVGDGLGEARSLQNLIRLIPAERSLYARLAALLLDHRSADAAAAVAAAGLRQSGNDAELWRLHGLSVYAMGRNDEAIQSFLRAIDAAPEDAAGYASLETLLPSAGAAAPEIAKRLLGFAERNPIGHFLLALLQPESRESRLRQALSGASDFWPAHYELGKLLRERGDAAGAITAFRKVLALNPEHAESHYALAELVTDRTQARRHRQEHHRIKQRAAAEEQARATARPRLSVTIQ